MKTFNLSDIDLTKYLFFTGKGGVGKTTISTNVAFDLTQRGYKVLLVDADPQLSVLSWADIRETPLPFSVMGMPKTAMKEELPKMKINGNFDFIVIDGAPRMTDLARAAIISSDFIIMPMQPSGYDLWATNELIQMVEEAKIYKSNLITAVVLNRVVGNTILAREMTKNMQENNWQFFDTNIHQRQLYSLAATQGLTVFDVDSKSESAKEISKFTDELLKVIKS